jgi:predicted MFS family arabinose efflux permease
MTRRDASMSFMKSAVVATLALATAFGSVSAANAGSRKTGYFIAGAAATALVLTAVRADECRKWKRLYKRTGNEKYLDRYYACM